MSDFDKEAEREKLREKYGDEAQERETTQQMSELLLQGATMTNRHCDECGDPVFRHEGQEFCPTCQSVAADGEAAQARDDDGGTADEGTTQHQVETGDAGTEPDSGEGDATDRATPPGGAPTPQSTRSTRTPTSEGERQDSGDYDRGRSPEPPATGGEDLAAAQDSLARTVARFARRAEETDDPRAAKEHLAAAREAAEALSALRR